MKDFIGDFCIIDGRVEKTEALDRISLSELNVCYEVIRVDDGIFLFLEDHLRRLRLSVMKIDTNYNIEFKYITDILLKLKSKTGLHSGNAKLLVGFHQGIKREILFIVYQTSHYYPTEKQYREGIRTSLFEIERDSPNLKKVNTSLQEKCRNEISARDVYEVLLVADDGCVTEGSKSNIFFVREGILLTPPASRVLKGITREKIIGICKGSGFTLMEENIPVNSLNQFDAAFLTGTSPKVLPIAFIGAVTLPVENPMISQLQAQYEELIGSYKARILQRGYQFD
jgi:branched-chain amino acid aminotransferase